MADPVDKLEVLVSLDLGPLEDKIDDVVDEVERLDGKSTDNLQDEFGDAEEAADDLTESIEDADSESLDVEVDDGEVSQLQRRLQALDGRSIEVDTDIDRNRLAGALSGGGGSREGIFGGQRLPGELDEVQEGFLALSAVPPQLKAVGGAAAAAATALGAGVGLAGVATKLAAELGPAGLQSDVQAARAEFKEVGREFASAFSGVIRSEVLPAARGLAAAVRNADDALASFSSVTIDFLKQLPGAGPAFAALVGAGRQASSGRAGVVQGTGNLTGLREIRSTLVKQIERVRERFKRGLIPKAEMLSQIKSFRLDAVKNLQKLEQKFPDAFPASVLDAFVAKLKQTRRRLEEVQSVSLEGVAPQPADASQVEGASLEAPGGGGVGQFIPDRVSAPSGVQKATQKLINFRVKLREAFRGLSAVRRLGARAFLRVGRSVGRTIGRVVTLQTEVSSLGQAFKRVGQSIVGVIQSVITKLVSAIAAAAALAALTGGTSLSIGGASGFSDFGKILGGVLGFAKGGVVQGATLGVVGEGTEDEAVMPLSRLSGFVEQAAQVGAVSLAPQMATAGINVTVNLQGERRTDGRDLKTAYDTTTRIQKRKRA